MIEPGMQIGHQSLAALLQRQGYSRCDTVVDAGEFAVRDRCSTSSLGARRRLRSISSADELESLRLFDPATQRSTGSVEQHLLLPASEALLDEETIKRFRGHYRELFGANATGDPLYRR